MLFNFSYYFKLIFLMIFCSLKLLDDLVLEKERYKDIGDDLDTAFVELILKE